MNSDSRATILSRVRESLADGPRLPTAREVQTPPATRLPPDRAQLIETFAAELTALSGVFHRCSARKAPQLVAGLCREANARRTLAWFAESLPVPGLLDALKAEGLTVVGPYVPQPGATRADRLNELESCEAGITGAEVALADVGGIVVRSGGGRGRLASLLPLTHIALFTPDQLYPSLFDWMEALRAEGQLNSFFREASNLTVIAGPSRTADIEKTLVLGVHGPKVLHVICVTDM